MLRLHAETKYYSFPYVTAPHFNTTGVFLRFSKADDDGSGDLTREELVAAYGDIFGSRSGLSTGVAGDNVPINALQGWEDFVSCDTLLSARQRFNVLPSHLAT